MLEHDNFYADLSNDCNVYDSLEKKRTLSKTHIKFKNIEYIQFRSIT